MRSSRRTAGPAPLQRARGFTLVEVLIALAITAFVATIAYNSLSTALLGVESTRETATRTYAINRALMVLERDLRQFVPRPIRDEFGDIEPALVGGRLARFPLSFTRAGWHNPNGLPRSQLQRVAYRLEDTVLWRDAWAVLDRAADSEPQSVILLEDVEYFDLRFLGGLEGMDLSDDSRDIDTRNWPEDWVPLNGGSGELVPPVALELTLELTDWGELRRLYALPPL